MNGNKKELLDLVLLPDSTGSANDGNPTMSL